MRSNYQGYNIISLGQKLNLPMAKARGFRSKDLVIKQIIYHRPRRWFECAPSKGA
jgi:hypothetical protein